MKRITSGLYEGEYKGVKFEVIKVETLDTSTKNQWYWKVGSTGGDDWFNSKKVAIEAVKEYINDIS